jgi:hypothetical protein
MHMDDDYDNIDSPLSQSITVDGHTVQIQIYRGPDTEWTLEVVDSGNGSNVWNDLFPTDLAALEEALRTIREEGITSFLVPPDAAPPE